MVAHKFSEKLSKDEQEARDEYLQELYIKCEFFKDEIREACQEIGGHFRSPGMVKEASDLVKDMLTQLQYTSFDISL